MVAIEGDRAAAHPYILYALYWALCFLAGDALLDFMFDGRHVAFSKRLSQHCRLILQITFATITSLLSLLAVEFLDLVHPTTQHHLWSWSLTLLCLMLNVVIPALAGIYCSVYFKITRPSAIAAVSFFVVYIIHVAVDALGLFVLRKSPDKHPSSVAALLAPLLSVHYGAWRLAIVGTIIAGSVVGFGTINAVVDEYLLSSGHGTDAEVGRAEEVRQSLSEVAERLTADVDVLVRTNPLSAVGKISRPPRSGPGAWNRQPVEDRIDRMRAGVARIDKAASAAAVTVLLLRELHGKREQSRHALGRAIRVATGVLCALAVYRLVVVVASGGLMLTSLNEALGASGLTVSTTTQYNTSQYIIPMSIQSANAQVGPYKPAQSSAVDGILAWVRSGQRLRRWYPVLSFLVLGGLAAGQINGLLSTAQILLHLHTSARSTEAFSLGLAYLAGSYFMACLLMLQRQFPSIKQVGFSEAFGAEFADSANEACIWYFNAFYVMSSIGSLYYLFKNKIERVTGAGPDARIVEKGAMENV